jgi:hypothetical protein
LHTVKHSDDGGIMATSVDSPAGAPAQRGRAPELLPFGWEPGPGPADQHEPRAVFRFPTADDPHPGTGQVLGMALYGALLGLGGVGVGLRALWSSLGGVPWWYVPALSLIGLVGVGLAVAAYLCVHRRRLSWALLLAAGIPLLGDIVLAAAY